jgi:hypothetical protein
MTRIWLMLALLVALPLQAQTPRVLIVGDSWAAEMWQDGAHEVVFASNGMGGVSALGATTTESGSTAAQWKEPARLQSIADALQANPTIDIVQLTVGGNDFLDVWSTAMTPMQVTLLKNRILADLDTIVDFILAQRADLEVLLSFYDYPNFRDTRSSLLGLLFCAPRWNDMGQPTPAQLNALAIEFVDAFAGVAAADPRIHHVRHFGLMQHHYGIDGIPAGQLALPGDAALPSPLVAMRDRGIGRDCFHLGPEGYDHLVQNLYDGYYRQRFDVSLFGDSFESP